MWQVGMDVVEFSWEGGMMYFIIWCSSWWWWWWRQKADLIWEEKTKDWLLKRLKQNRCNTAGFREVFESCWGQKVVLSRVRCKEKETLRIKWDLKERLHHVFLRNPMIHRFSPLEKSNCNENPRVCRFARRVWSFCASLRWPRTPSCTGSCFVPKRRRCWNTNTGQVTNVWGWMFLKDSGWSRWITRWCYL